MKPINRDKVIKAIDHQYPSDQHENRCAYIAALIAVKSFEAAQKPIEPIAEQYRLQPHIIALAAVTLTTAAKNIQNFAVLECNQELAPHQEKNYQKNRDRFTELANALGFDAETSGDPRGCVAKLINPDDPKEGDNWGGGWGVY